MSFIFIEKKAVIENLISSSNASQNENKEDNIIITKKTSGMFHKLKY